MLRGAKETPAHRGSDGLLVEAMVVAVELAAVVARARIQKADREKGRCRPMERLSSRVQETWVVVLTDAARMSADHAGNPERHVLKMIKQLQIELALATRGRGRPRRNAEVPASGPGMLSCIGAQPMNETPPGADSKLRKFYGLKLRLYVRRRQLDRGIKISAALAHLRRHAYDEYGARTPEAVTRALDALIKDRPVALMDKAESLFGSSGTALAKSIQRAREKFGFVLPLGGI